MIYLQWAADEANFQTHIVLSQRDWEYLMEMLDRPPQPSPALVKLMRTKVIWERDGSK